jgi:flagellum-specific peptidoglycan hydrolase FlgJ
MQPYANTAASALGMDASVILAQWALESGNGTSDMAVNHNNHAGIKWSQYSKTAKKRSDSSFAHYNSLSDFVTDYVRVISLSYYDGVRDATTIEGTVKALGASPYDAGHYESGGVKGGKLLTMLGLSGGSTPEKKPTAAVCPTCHRPL